MNKDVCYVFFLWVSGLCTSAGFYLPFVHSLAGERGRRGIDVPQRRREGWRSFLLRSGLWERRMKTQLRDHYLDTPLFLCQNYLWCVQERSVICFIVHALSSPASSGGQASKQN